MWGIACVFISSVLFIHLGLGETIGKLLRTDFVLFRCVKCLTFWCVLGYSLLCVSIPAEAAVCIAFMCAYAALWAELLLGKLANAYEKLSEDVATEEPQGVPGAKRDQEGEGGESQEGSLPEL